MKYFLATCLLAFVPFSFWHSGTVVSPFVNYYVANAGSDSNNGLSPAAPFQTVGKVNSLALGYTNIINFKGGDIFSDATLLPKSGSTTTNILYTSYGTGQAIISNAATYACLTTNKQCFTLSNFCFKSAIAAQDGSTGIWGVVRVLVNSTGNTMYSNVYVFNCTVVGGLNGISVESPASVLDGIYNLQISNNAVSNATEFGIYTQEAGQTQTRLHYPNCHISSNFVFNITGDTQTATANGCGIVGGCLSNSLILGNTVTDCGRLSTVVTAGPAGIFLIGSLGSGVEGNNVQREDGAGGIDQSGIGCDLATSNCYVLFNHVADCTGAAYYNLCDSGNIFAFNEGVNCATKINYEVMLYYKCDFYNNTIVGGAASCINAQASNTRILNNIFANDASQQANFANLTVVDGNNYYSTVGLGLLYNSVAYTTLAAFRTGTGQENIGSVARGVFADPTLVDRYQSVQLVTGGDIANHLNLAPQSGSPADQAGLNLNSLFSITVPTTDIRGVTLRSPCSIGAWDTLGTRPSGTGYANAVLADIPAVYHRGNETSGTAAVDSSGHLFTGSFYSGATLNQTPVFSGNTASFNSSGTGGIVVDSRFAPAGNVAITLEAWFNITSTGQSSYLWFRWGSGANQSFLLQYVSNTILAAVQNGGNFVINNPTASVGSGAHYIAATWYGANNFDIYLDGSLMTANYSTRNNVASLQSITNQSLGGWAVSGNMSDLAAYLYPLSSTRISAHYAARNTP